MNEPQNGHFRARLRHDAMHSSGQLLLRVSRRSPERRLSQIKTIRKVWNSFKSSVFLLRRSYLFTIEKLASSSLGLLNSMIVCSCNVLTDHDVRSALNPDGGNARSAGEVHRCLGCSRQCGRCMHTIRKIMNDAVCPVGHAHAHVS
jgi:bacterioferritin-associated ferredoxin